MCNRDGERTRERGSASDTAREQETFGSERGREAEVESRETSILYLGTFVHAIAPSPAPMARPPTSSHIQIQRKKVSLALGLALSRPILPRPAHPPLPPCVRARACRDAPDRPTDRPPSRQSFERGLKNKNGQSSVAPGAETQGKNGAYDLV